MTIPLITQNCHEEIHSSITIFAHTTGIVALLSWHLSKAAILRVEPIPALIYINEITCTLPSYPVRKCLTPILMTLEQVDGWVGQVGSCGSSLPKETKSKLYTVNLGLRVWGIHRVAIVNVGVHFVNVCLWMYHPIHCQVYEILPVNLMCWEGIAQSLHWENISFCLILMNPLLAHGERGEFSLVM